ncbi:hypothetical protein [Phytohabitans houttuyneae]|uniref:Apea-like HEPN domain-containing protein n=1 Tax=Phytohabitans houttuyneae TaxID=1076126 RepID=A0A6V8K514_9ACTN|nr:hypothetical protein [Phytohabitans houttuyneae]GFJ77408.1 hypothetical protein Phou_015880 [Phytohabitans houttuyneae]
MTHEFGIYEQVLPMGWIGDRPADYGVAGQVGANTPSLWQRVVVDRKLVCGVNVTMQQRGFTVYNVRGWPPGMPNYGGGWYRTVGQAAAAELPALVQRLRLVNAHIALLHCAAMHHDNQSPPVLRVRSSDLYRYEPSEDGTDGWWVGQGRSEPSLIGPADGMRINDALPLAVAEAALDWLDVVVARDALVDFARLNQGQDALGTQDFSTALDALWQICESRLHKLAAEHHLNVRARAAVSEVMRKLDQRVLLPAGVKDRLDQVREERNALLHQGAEPSAETAHECLSLATELLKTVVPDLATRAPKHMFLLQ